MRVKQFLASCLLGGALLAALTGGAGAAPMNARSETFPITCGGQNIMVTVATVANGKEDILIFNPAFTANGAVLIPVSFVFKATLNGQTVFEQAATKGNAATALAGRTTTCTFGGTFTEDGQTFVFTGTAEVLTAGKR
jgi:hypothetical protein